MLLLKKKMYMVVNMYSTRCGTNTLVGKGLRYYVTLQSVLVQSFKVSVILLTQITIIENLLRM